MKLVTGLPPRHLVAPFEMPSVRASFVSGRTVPGHTERAVGKGVQEGEF
ncbi:MAG TPA: hypothetical protein VIF40_19905 [Methylosinus sp.]